MVAVQLHHLAQVGGDLFAPAVARHLKQVQVKSFVRGKEAVPVLGARLEFDVQVFQLTELVCRGIACHRRGGVAFEQGQQVEHLGEVACGHLGNVGAAAQFHRHQAFAGQHLQCFAQRRSADAEFGAQSLLIDPTPGAELMSENALTQTLGDGLVERRFGQMPLQHSLNG